MNNTTQMFKLYEILKSGEPVKIDAIVSELSIKPSSLPVYIHNLKKLKADVKSIKENKFVVSYQLLNPQDVKVQEFRKNSLSIPKKISTTVSIVLDADEIPENDANLPTEKDLADIRRNLGLKEDYGSLAD